MSSARGNFEPLPTVGRRADIQARRSANQGHHSDVSRSIVPELAADCQLRRATSRRSVTATLIQRTTRMTTLVSAASIDIPLTGFFRRSLNNGTQQPMIQTRQTIAESPKPVRKDDARLPATLDGGDTTNRHIKRDQVAHTIVNTRVRSADGASYEDASSTLSPTS